MGFGKSLIYQIFLKVLECLQNGSDETKTFIVCIVSPLEYIRKQVVNINKLNCGLCAAAIGSDEMEKEIEEGSVNMCAIIALTSLVPVFY